MEPAADIALIGLAVMGQNLILNMDDHGFTVVAYNRSTEKVDRFLANEARGTKVLGAHSIAEMVARLKKPRRVMMLVKAGRPVDEFIDQLIPHLDAGDIILQWPVPIRPRDSLHDLMVRSKVVGARAVLDAIEQIEHGSAPRRSMDPAQATYFSFPTREDARRLRRMGRALL